MSDDMVYEGGMSFCDYVEHERARLDAALSKLTQDRALIDEQIAQKKREMEAVNAYEATRAGKGARFAAPAARAPRTNWRESVVSALHGNLDGMKRAELLQALRVKGDKSAETGVSNALIALKKTGQIASHNGRYFSAEQATRLAAE